jgi:hypothetical protein
MEEEKKNNPGGPKRLDLDQQYGRIGISAVAAAVRYQSEAKNPAYAPKPASTPWVEPDDMTA